ncbi:MAG TPA: hypothetical protein VFG10_12030 [Saprospiraceae bacterium]|nr:hypothetical protein [Saprospiraceae bacterium]
MKNIKLTISFLFAFLLVAVSCNDDEFVKYEGEAFSQITDPYLQILTPVISFQAGTPSYALKVHVINGTEAKRITAVDVYKVFTDIVTGEKSNEALLKSYPVGPGTTLIDDQLTYADLKAGLTVNGGSLPDDETALALGSGWTLRFVGKTAAGDKRMNGSVQVSVLSRFAGLYEVIESSYYRIGVLTATWNGEKRFIGSIDENTFSYNGFWGNFPWADHSFNFDLNESDYSIEVPIIVNGIYAGSRAMNCRVEPALFTSVSCAGSNVLIPDDLNGKHIIKLTYGYYTDGSGSREFQEVLQKL